MKKRLVALVLAMSMVTVMTTGCGENKEAAATSVSADAAAPSESEADSSDYGELLGDADLSQYVALGEYKNLEAAYKPETPTETEIQDKIDSDLDAQAKEEEITGRPVQDGDIVNIDYEGKKDGVAFDGGTAAGFDLTIGSGTFIPGFEDGLIGAEAGTTVDLPLTFPENYHSEELAGAEVVFTVKVNSIKEKVKPELTDEVAAAINPDCKSVDEYKAAVENELKASYEEQAMTDTKGDLIAQAVENAEIKEIPETLLREKKDYLRSNAENYAAYYGMSFEDFLSQALNTTEEEFTAQCEELAGEDAKQVLVCFAIAQAEGLVLSKEEAAGELQGYMSQFGANSFDEFMTTPEGRGFYEFVHMNSVADFLFENAKID